LSGEVKNCRELVELVRKNFPQYSGKLPTRELSGGFGAGLVKLSSYFEKKKGTAHYMRAQAGKTDLRIDNSKSTRDLKVEYASAEEISM
jgi:hypothetical protein